jgi:hypothetical protein
VWALFVGSVSTAGGAARLGRAVTVRIVPPIDAVLPSEIVEADPQVVSGSSVYVIREPPALLFDLGAGHRPVSVVRAGMLVFDDERDLVVGDSASDAVVVLRRLSDVDLAFAVAQSVSVGGDPVTVTTGNLDEDIGGDVVYGTTTGELGVLLSRGGTLAPAQRLALGGGVIRVVEGVGQGDVIAVTRSPGSVVLLHFGTDGLRTVRRIALGFEPAAVTTAGEGLVIAAADRPALAMVSLERLSAGAPGVLQRVVLPDGFIATDVLRARLDRDGDDDLFVADRGTGAVAVLFGAQGRRRFAPGPVVRLGRPVTGVFAADVVQDSLDDMMVADPAVGGLTVIPVLGDALVAADPSASAIATGFGMVVWDRAHGRTHRLVSRSRGRTGIVSGVSRRPIEADIGRDRAGQPTVYYARCGPGRCRPFAWSPRAGEREIRVRTAAGCSIEQFLRWRGAIAYRTGPPRRGCHRPAGAWVQWPGRRPRQLAGRFSALGDLHAARVGWSELGGRIGRSKTDVARLVVRSRDGRERVLYREPLDRGLTASKLKGPQFDGAAVYWSIGGPSEDGDRCRIGGLLPGRRAQPALFAGFDLCTGQAAGGLVDFAVDAGRLFYVGARGVLQADREEWRRCTRRSGGCTG